MEKLVSDGYSAFLQDQVHVDWRLFYENFEWIKSLMSKTWK